MRLNITKLRLVGPNGTNVEIVIDQTIEMVPQLENGAGCTEVSVTLKYESVTTLPGEG